MILQKQCRRNLVQGNIGIMIYQFLNQSKAIQYSTKNPPKSHQHKEKGNKEQKSKPKSLITINKFPSINTRQRTALIPMKLTHDPHSCSRISIILEQSSANPSQHHTIQHF